jgi:hypothetical protein
VAAPGCCLHFKERLKRHDPSNLQPIYRILAKQKKASVFLEITGDHLPGDVGEPVVTRRAPRPGASATSGV